MESMVRKLSNGVNMSSIGFGTYKLGEEQDVIDRVKLALEIGYRQIDTASFYGNEEGVGKGIAQSGVDRKDIFLVTKLWNDDHGYEETINAFNKSIKKLGIDYLDLYLIHWPNKLNSETWRAFEDLYKEGKVRAIGVCNFKIGHLEELKKIAKIMPMVNQIEIHPCKTQKDIIEYCKENNIQVVAWGPIMRGKIFSLPLMLDLAEKYNKSIAQITLRWHIQNGVIPIPKSSNEERIKANIDIFDFNLSNEDMKKIDSLNSNEDVSGVPDNTTYLDL
ncbi:aldo/keto reductase [Clostridium sp. NSJ-6]|uniref:Aldo/keto reductase n=1 Tax=Clostridium hominis TaxID=2763036 RepID=A0ABR7D8Z7_9CLOT|nr:aldo/keto reductase [Clostridium hominis]MBC5627808.1 aldo/keto reductase [Clostridium hominis]